jgi:hypothetical protein
VAVNLVRKNHAITNLLGWLMLLIFTFEHTPLANTAIFLAASWSGEHEVQLRNTGEKVRIVLHHHGLAGHHSSITKALLFLTNVTEDGQQDHILGGSVAPNISVQIASKFADPRINSLAKVVNFSAEPVSFGIGNFVKSLRVARPPPLDVFVHSASTLVCLKTIVLLV